MMPKGGPSLKAAKALQPQQRADGPVAGDMTPDQAVALYVDGQEPVLTLQGWACPAPLVPHVDREKQKLAEAGKDGTDAEALRQILTRLAPLQRRNTFDMLKQLGKWKTRLSRDRRKAAVTKPPEKVPPEGGCT